MSSESESNQIKIYWDEKTKRQVFECERSNTTIVLERKLSSTIDDMRLSFQIQKFLLNHDLEARRIGTISNLSETLTGVYNNFMVRIGGNPINTNTQHSENLEAPENVENQGASETP